MLYVVAVFHFAFPALDGRDEREGAVLCCSTLFFVIPVPPSAGYTSAGIQSIIPFSMGAPLSL